MENQLISTKLYQPAPRRGWLERPRLFSRLSAALDPGCRLALIAAPAGYGKTTLASAWLARTAGQGLAQFAWLSLDEEDNDPARLLTYLVAALSKVSPDLGSGLLSLVTNPQLPALERLFGELNADLSALIPPNLPLFLALDDFHVLQEPALLDALAQFFERLPAHVRLLITTREDPPFPLPRLRARGELVELRGKDLRFNRDETGAFFNSTFQLDLSSAAIGELETRTEGWIAGLQLAALALRDSTASDIEAEDVPSTAANPAAVEDFITAFRGSHRYIIDYLVDEVLQRQPEEVRRFLCQTAVLDRFCAGLCAELTGAPDVQAAQKMLEYLDRSNLFLVPLDGERRWFRYHRLFADVLRSGLDPALEEEMHRRAARWWETQAAAAGSSLAQGRDRADLTVLAPAAAEAIRHDLAGRSYPSAARLIAAYGVHSIHLGETRTLLTWLDILPDAVLLNEPDLPILKAFGLLLTGQPKAALGWMALSRERANLEPVSTDSPARIRLGRLLAIEAWLAQLTRQPDAARLAAQAVALLADDPFFRAFALIPYGTALDAAADAAGAAAAYREVYEIGEQSGHLFVAVGGLANLVFNLLNQGLLRDAKAACEQAFQRHVDRRGRPLPLLGLIYIPYAALLLEEYNLEGAADYARRGLDLCQGLFSSLMMGGDGELILAQVALQRGERETALSILSAARQAARERGIPAIVVRLNLMEISLLTRLGELDRAQQMMAELDESGLVKDGLGSAQSPFPRARLLVAQGAFEQARVILSAMEEKVCRSGLNGMRLVLLILKAQLEEAAGNHARAIDFINEALVRAAPEGFRSVFLREGPSLRPLLEDARSTAPAFVDRLLADIPGSRPAPSPAPAHPGFPEPLSKQELTILHLLAQGKSNQEIADQLYISIGTAKWHVHNILAKLGSTSRTQAIVTAREMGILS